MTLRSDRRRPAIAWFGLVLLLTVRCTGGRGPGDGPIGIGSLAPDFELRDLTGGTVRLSSLRGKIVFVNFWATWCAPCRVEMPAMESLQRTLAGEKFVMLAVSVDEGGEAVLRPFLADIPHTYPVLLDAGEGGRRLASPTARSYQITGVPETFIVDAKGYIVEKVIGPADWSSAEMIAYFRRLIAAGAS
jgi:peroxiredoxin